MENLTIEVVTVLNLDKIRQNRHTEFINLEKKRFEQLKKEHNTTYQRFGNKIRISVFIPVRIQGRQTSEFMPDPILNFKYPGKLIYYLHFNVVSTKSEANMYCLADGTICEPHEFDFSKDYFVESFKIKLKENFHDLRIVSTELSHKNIRISIFEYLIKFNHDLISVDRDLHESKVTSMEKSKSINVVFNASRIYSKAINECISKREELEKYFCKVSKVKV